MRTKTALQRRDDAKSAIRDAYSTARTFGQTHKTLHERYMQIYDKYLPGTPGRIRDYLDGYRQHVMDSAYEHDLVYGGFYNGRFYTTHSNRADYYGNNDIEPRAWADHGDVRDRGHYWRVWVDKGDPKPFFISA